MNWVRSIAAVAFCIFLVSCGGGGSNKNGSLPDVPEIRVGTHAHSSITYSNYTRRRNTLASQYRSEKTFKSQYGLGMIKADVALANLNLKRGSDAADAPGSGVKVGVIDSGIDNNSPAFDYTLVTESFANSAVNEAPQTFSSINQVSHGTSVASVIGSQKSDEVWTDRGFSQSIQDNHFHGVAWGASISMTAIPLGSGGSGGYTAVSLTNLSAADSAWSSLYSGTLGSDIDFLNLSFGVDGNIEGYTATQLRSSFSQSIATMAQAGSSDKTIFVWAAGNAGSAGNTSCNANGLPNICINNRPNKSSPEIFSGMMARISELRGHTIAVVSVGSNGSISGFSNRCGIAANWCIAAPGGSIRTVIYGAAESQTVPGTVDPNLVSRGHRTRSGTSFAAPFVTGGLALMKDVFRSQLSNTQLVTRLFATANKRGRYASRTIYGQGLMDLGAATSIVGNPVIASGTSVDSGGIALTKTSMQLGHSFGDALHRSLNRQEVMVLDQLQAPFWFSLSDFVNSTPSGNELMHAVQRTLIDNQVRAQSIDSGEKTWKFAPFLPDYRAGKQVDSDTEAQFGQLYFREGSSSSHLGLAYGSLATSFQSSSNTVFSVFTTADKKSRGLLVSGLTMSHTPSLKVPAYLTLGMISERESILRSKSYGAFGSTAATALFFGTGTSTEVGSWRISGEGELGVFNPRINGGMIKKMSPLATSAFSIQARRQINTDNSLTFDVSQKLRVESGRTEMSIPVARTHEGGVTYSNRDVDLIPSGRQIDFSIRWDHSPNRNGRFFLESAIIKDPGHIRGAKPEGRIIATWHQRF